MSRHKITNSSSQAVPFSWEQLPGISKTTTVQKTDEKPKLQNPVHHHRATKLRPPPSQSRRLIVPSHHRTQTGRKGGGGILRPELDDPFLAAFIECTKSVDEEDNNKERPPMKSNSSWPRTIQRLRVGGFGILMSCKSSSAVRVREGNLVKLPKLPEREEADFDW